MKQCTRDFGARAGRWPLALGAALLVAACSGPGRPTASSGPAANTGRSTQDARVKSYRGQVPPDVFTQGTWVGPAGETSLAAQRGRVVFVMFAFPQ